MSTILYTKEDSKDSYYNQQQSHIQSDMKLRSVAILEYIMNSTLTRLYANGSRDGPLAKRDSGIARLILRV